MNKNIIKKMILALLSIIAVEANSLHGMNHREANDQLIKSLIDDELLFRPKFEPFEKALVNGANPNLMFSKYPLLWHLTADYSDYQDFVALLLKYGANPDIKGTNGHTLMDRLVSNREFDIMGRIVHLSDKFYTDIIKLLVKYGASIEAYNKLSKAHEHVKFAGLESFFRIINIVDKFDIKTLTKNDINVLKNLDIKILTTKNLEELENNDFTCLHKYDIKAQNSGAMKKFFTFIKKDINKLFDKNKINIHPANDYEIILNRLLFNIINKNKLHPGYNPKEIYKSIGDLGIEKDTVLCLIMTLKDDNEKMLLFNFKHFDTFIKYN